MLNYIPEITSNIFISVLIVIVIPLYYFIFRELLYAVDNLCRDVHFRSYMDVDGYVPLIFLYNFPTVGSIGADYYELLESLGQSTLLEISLENETVRLKDNWAVVS